MRRVVRLTLYCTLCVFSFHLVSDRCGAQTWKDQTNDVVSGTFSVKDVSQKIDLDDDVEALAAGKSIAWDKTSSKGLIALAKAVAGNDACVTGRDTHNVYIFHISTWGVSTAPFLKTSRWYAYRFARFADKAHQLTLYPVSLGGDGAPVIYGAKKAVIVVADHLDASAQFQESYSTLVTQDVPENLANTASLIAQLTGVSKQAGAGGSSLYAAAVCQNGARTLPFELKISGVATDGSAGAKEPAATSSAAVCSGSGNTLPCATTRTFKSLDREWWDFSAGVAIPGARETSFSFDTKSNTTNAKVTRHTELYALLDIFPWAPLIPKQSIAPHLSLGVPLTTKSLYRPYFGVSENLTGWTGVQRLLRLPVAINFLAGVTYMKTQTIQTTLPTTQADFDKALHYHRITKPMFGIEVPLGSTASKGSKGK